MARSRGVGVVSSNPEGIDRDRTPEAMYLDEVLDLVTKEEEEEDGKGE